MAPHDADDSALLAAWRDGDVEAGQRLFERHASAITYFFRNKMTEGVEDFVQRTFLALVEKRERLDATTNVRAYLFGIAHNLLYKALRTKSRSPHFDPSVSSIAQLHPGPSTMVARKREQRLLLEGLRRIPVDHQVALELYYWEGLNAAQIAEIVGISHSAMRSRLAKARTLLREAIAALPSEAAQRDSTLGDLEGWATSLRREEPS